jgi:4-amino-4-deoxy-L-arabinose transferase-like glycosyltransferase/polyisoprenoid-binding protein YceI
MDVPNRPAGLTLELSRLVALVRGRSWVRPALLGVLLLTAALYVWGLDRNGYANSYYSAAVLAGTRSWKAFFFGAFDAGSFITVDKPPAALWLMALYGRIFGFSSWSLLLPEALLGVATVALVFATVRRLFGPVAGLTAAVVMALTPVAVLMFRFNNPDALLTFLLVAAAWALARALESGRARWLLLSAAIVGLAFDTKYLQAYIVLPAFVLTYLLLGPGTWARRLGQLLAAAGALPVSSGWWPTIVTLVPAGSRPYIGGSTDNSVLNLVLGYDGFGRLTGAIGAFGRSAAGGAARAFGGGGGPGGAGGFGGQPGLLRLFNSQLGGEISWLLPLAAVAIGAGLWARRGQPRTDLARAGYVLWGTWLLTHAVVFSFASGILHAYYTVAMAPAVAALVGAGAVDLWRLRSRSLAGGALAAAGLLVTAWWGAQLLARTPDFAPGLGSAELALAAVAAVLLLVPRSFQLPRRLPAAALGAGLVAVLLGPAAYAIDTAGHATTGADPSSGPAVTTALGPPGGRFAGAGQPPGAGQPGGLAGGVDSALLGYLEQRQPGRADRARHRQGGAGHGRVHGQRPGPHRRAPAGTRAVRPAPVRAHGRRRPGRARRRARGPRRVRGPQRVRPAIRRRGRRRSAVGDRVGDAELHGGGLQRQRRQRALRLLGRGGRIGVMRRTVIIGGAAFGIAALVALGGAYAYYFSGLRTAPRPLSLSPAATASAAPASATSPAGATSLVGAWTVASGSQAGYRVSEVFVGQTSSHEAVARTSSVTGGLTVQQGTSGLQVTALRFTAQLTNLASVDQVAGRDVSQRDRIVSQTLSVFQYPTATFQAQGGDLPAGLESGQTVTLTIPGQLTIHGVTKTVQVSVQARLTGSQVQAAGSTSFAMTDFGISPPQVPITSVDPQVTLEFSLVLTRS